MRLFACKPSRGLILPGILLVLLGYGSGQAFSQDFGIRISSSQTSLHLGDTLHLNLEVWNRESQAFDVDFYLVLYVGGAYYFYPAFTEAISPVASFSLPGQILVAPTELFAVLLDTDFPVPVRLTWYAMLISSAHPASVFHISSLDMTLGLVVPTPTPTAIPDTAIPTPTLTSTPSPTTTPIPTATPSPTETQPPDPIRDNQNCAIESAKILVLAEFDYFHTAQPNTFTALLSNLATGSGAGDLPFIDPQLGSGLKCGYTFSMVAGNGVLTAGEDAYWAWSACAWPISYPSTGIKSFYIDETGIVRGSDVGGVILDKQGRGVDATTNILRTIISADEDDALESMEVLDIGEAGYFAGSSPSTFAGALIALASGSGAGDLPYIDPELGSGIKSGYTFTLVRGNAVVTRGAYAYWAWSAAARPVSYKSSGTKSYYVDPTGVIRASDIIGIVGTIEMPPEATARNTLQEIIQANAACALSSMRILPTAQDDYYNQSVPTTTFSCTLSDLASGQGAGNQPFIDPDLGSGVVTPSRWSATPRFPARQRLGRQRHGRYRIIIRGFGPITWTRWESSGLPT